MTMKKTLLLLLAAVLLLQACALAESFETLTVGSKGPRVLEVKERLRDLRYTTDRQLTKKYTEKTAAAVRLFQAANGLPETGDADEATQAALFAEAAVKKPYATLAPLATPGPTPAVDWPETDAEGFLAGEGTYCYENDEEGLWIWLTPSLRIVITAREDSSIPLEWFETDIRTRGGEGFYSVMTDPERPGKKYRYPYDIARDAGCVLAFSDDFFATRMDSKETVGIIIRDGRIIRSDTHRTSGHHLPNLDMMIQYPDGRLEVCHCTEHTAEELQAAGAVNVFSCGPILIRDGKINELVYQYYKSIEPRHALGMIEPGHYLLLSVQGRTRDSKGTSLQRVADLMKARGVTQALNLDGGNTMALVFRGRMLNKLATDQKRDFVRTVTSVIAIGKDSGDASR